MAGLLSDRPRSRPQRTAPLPAPEPRSLGRPKSSAWLVVEVGVFDSRYSHRIVERNMIALAPVLFIGLVLWLDRPGR
jgi:hypothetical protein